MEKIKRIGFNLMTLIIPGILLFGSCVEKPLEDTNVPVGPVEASIENLKAPEFFEWETSQEVTVNIQGLTMDVGVIRKLSLLSNDGIEIYAGAHNMNENFEMSFDLPLDIKKIIMKYGTTAKSSEILNKTVVFTFESEREVEIPEVIYPEIIFD